MCLCVRVYHLDVFNAMRRYQREKPYNRILWLHIRVVHSLSAIFVKKVRTILYNILYDFCWLKLMLLLLFIIIIRIHSKGKIKKTYTVDTFKL